jgi:hypothetical protein
MYALMIIVFLGIIHPLVFYSNLKRSTFRRPDSVSVNPAWTSLPSELPLSQQESENWNSVQCFYICTIQKICLFSDEFYSDFNNSSRENYMDAWAYVLDLMSVEFFKYF